MSSVTILPSIPVSTFLEFSSKMTFYITFPMTLSLRNKLANILLRGRSSTVVRNAASSKIKTILASMKEI
jgi:hypothetical protein